MSGLDLIARSISASRIPDKHGNVWQYHPRSDRHSKIACWVIAFDLMLRSELLRAHLSERKVVLAVNHSLRDFETQRTKVLDLVIGQPDTGPAASAEPSFATMAGRWGVELGAAERSALARLPHAAQAPVGSVLVALEAKAAMTAHVRALPRLHDELDSSHSTTHGNSERALAVGFVMVNAARTFVSPDRNKFDLSTAPPNVNRHRQPADAERVIGKVSEIRRRSGPSGAGFDALGISVVEMTNDGTPMVVVDEPAATFTYDAMVQRVAHEYAANFSRI